MCEAFGDALVLLFVKGRFIAIENLSSQYMAEHTEAVDTVRQTRHKMLTAKLSHLDATRVPYWFYELKTPLAKHHGQCSSSQHHGREVLLNVSLRQCTAESYVQHTLQREVMV